MSIKKERFLRIFHSYPIIFQKTGIFLGFEREKIDFWKSDFVRFFQKYFFILFCATFRGETNAFCFFLSPIPLTFSFCAVKLFRNAAVSFSIYMRLRSFGQKTPSFSRGLMLAAGSYAHNSLWASARRLPCGSFAHPLRARRQPPRLATEHFSFFHDFMGQLSHNFQKTGIFAMFEQEKIDFWKNSFVRFL